MDDFSNPHGAGTFTPDAAAMGRWRGGLRPVTDRYIADLAAKGFANARATYDKLMATLRR